MNCCNSCFGVVFLYSLFLSLLVRTAASEASASELASARELASASELASSRLVGKDSKEKKKKPTSNLLDKLKADTGGNLARSGPASHGSPWCS